MSLATFISKITNIDMVQKYSERVSSLCGVSLENLLHTPYVTLKHDIPGLIDKGQYDQALTEVLWAAVEPKIKRFSNFKHRYLSIKVRRTNNYKKLKFLFWIQDQYKAINKLERDYLANPPDPKLVAAGIDKLNILGDRNIIDSLAGGDILKWSKIEKLPYSLIFDKQLKVVIESRINKELVILNKNS